MESLIAILEKVDLDNNPKTIEMMDRAISNAYEDASDKGECEILIAIAHKYKLPCLEDMLNTIDLVEELSFINPKNSKL